MSRPLRILQIADVPPDLNSGAAGTELELAKALASLGHEVVSLWQDRFPHRIRHWNTYHLVEQPYAYRTAIREEVDRRGQFDVYHVNQPAGWLAAREHRRGGRTGLFVHRSHGFEPRVAAVVRYWSAAYPAPGRSTWRRALSGTISRLLERNYRGIVRWASAHVVSCSECAEDLLRRGVDGARIHACPQAVSRELTSEPRSAWSTDRSNHLLHVGQYRFFKAPMLVAAAMNRWVASAPDRQGIWVAAAADHAKIRQLLDASARDRIELLPWQPRAELRRVFDRSGFFVFPSFTEGFGKVFLEAMARGLCVVASDQGGARDLIDSGRDGVLVPVGDRERLLAELLAIAAEPSRAEAMGEAAAATAQEYTWERLAESLATFYRERLEAERGLS